MAKERPVYEERSGWPWWVHFLVLVCVVAALSPLAGAFLGRGGGGGDSLSPGGAILCAGCAVGIPGLLYGLFGQLRTRVKRKELELAWGVSEVIRKRIPFNEIREAEAVTYSPMMELGGWGIRAGGRKKLAWTISGNRALLLYLEDGTRFYLGSKHPDRLLMRLEAIGTGRTEET
jgi:hypothetical protein